MNDHFGVEPSFSRDSFRSLAATFKIEGVFAAA
jgi:hypothetical protein